MAEPKSGPELTTLRLLLSKGTISQAEYDMAVKELTDTMGLRAGEANTLVIGKWATSIYGFVEADGIYDTTESFNEIQGNSPVQRPAAYAGSHDRMQFTIRNSRLGLRLKAPEVSGIRASGQLEMDFFGGGVNSNSGLGTAPTPSLTGNDPSVAAAAQGTANQEGVVFNNAILRIRHANLKVETPVVDFLVGQYWTLFGWHGQYLPATVQIQGITGEIFSRQLQFQISKTLKTDDVTFEAAIAAGRPVQRDSGMPVGQAGLRLAVNKWTAPQTLNYASTSIQPLSIAVTGDVRTIRVPSLTAPKTDQVSQTGGAFAVDAFIPVIPGSKDKKGNSLALDGEFTTGSGYGDMFTGLTGGTSTVGALPAGAATGAPAGGPAGYNPHLDNGIGFFDAGGSLHLIQLTSFVAGFQYYLPGKGNWIIAANYSRIQTGNLKGTLPAASDDATLDHQDFFDANLYWDMTPAVRLGLEYANVKTTYNDGGAAINHRGDFTAGFLF